jgi:hypothetical protein
VSLSENSPKIALPPNHCATTCRKLYNDKTLKERGVRFEKEGKGIFFGREK